MPLPPVVRIEKVQANTLPIDMPGPGWFPAGTDRFDFIYTAIHLSDPQQIDFSTRLEGLEKQWSRPEKRRSRNFADLAPGRYLFRVKARGQAGIWNESGDRFSFTIRPTFQQTIWFYFLILQAGIAALAAGLLFFRQRKARGAKTR